MGFENRDYFRDGSYTDRISGLGLDFTPVVKYLIVANVVVFLLQIFLTRPPMARDLTAFFPEIPDEQRSEWEAAEAEATKPREGKKAEDPEVLRKRQEEVARRMQEYLERVAAGIYPGMRISVVQEWCSLDPKKTVLQGQVWRLVTCAFCHDRISIWHIVFNMLLLYWFGSRLERMYGSREFLLFYLAAAVASSLAYVALAFYTHSYIPAIGASGAVMGVMMLYTIFYPFETVLLFWFLPVPICVLLGAYVIFDLHPVLLSLSGDRIYTGIAHAGHLGGLAFGFLYWKLGVRLEAPFERAGVRRRRPVRRPQARPAPAPADTYADSLDDQVDQVLRKISEHGQASLTPEEREVLVKASARYRGQA
jgi:membrane associated rhomboid family serine protease